MFFFEKKNQKTFDHIEPGGAEENDQRAPGTAKSLKRR